LLVDYDASRLSSGLFFVVATTPAIWKLRVSAPEPGPTCGADAFPTHPERTGPFPLAATLASLGTTATRRVIQ